LAARWTYGEWVQPDLDLFLQAFLRPHPRLRLGNNKNVQLGFITYTMNDKTEEVYCKIGKIFKVGNKVNFKTIHRPSYGRV